MDNNQKKTLIYGASFLALIAILIFLFLIPFYKNLSKTKSDIAEKQNQFSQNQSNIAYLTKLSSDQASFDKLYNSANGYWPDDAEVSKFLIQTDGLATDLGLVIQTVSINDKVNGKDGKPLPEKGFTLSFSADYPTTLQFLKKLENMARFNSENSIGLTLGDQNNLSAQITGFIYYGK